MRYCWERTGKHFPRGVAAALMGTALLILACGPAPAPTGPRDADGAGRAAATKTLVMGVQSEPETIVAYGRPSAIGTKDTERYFTFHANLTMFDIQGNVVTQLAQKVPTIQDGDWTVSPDGTMEVTWKIRPDARWHDGAPLTAEDYVFGFEVVMNPSLGVAELGEVLNIAGVQARDAETLVVSWKTLSIWGNHNGTEALPPIPRHLLRDLYLTRDYLAFEASPIWTTQWVGLGPYRLSRWEQGSHLEAAAFDHYVLGRPKIDRMLIRFIPDSNVMMANLLAGTVDVAPLASMLKPEQLAELQKIWGNGDAYASPNAMRILNLQFRDPAAAWVRDLRFRQAMMHAINRVQFVEALQHGQTEFGHYLAMPDDPVTRLAEQRGVTQYAYDPARAERLFAEAGWARGPDRLLRNSAAQTVPFVCCRRFDADANDVRESLALVSELQAAGLEAQHPLPSAPAGLSSTETRKFEALNRHGNIGPFRFNQRGSLASIVSGQIANDETRWTGSNAGGWSNATYDGLFAEMMRTFDAAPRQELAFQLVKLAAEELPVLPLYYSPVGVAVRKGVEGINRKPHAPPLTQNTTWNIHLWDVK